MYASILSFLASVYGEGVYGEGIYSGEEATGSGLADTGLWIVGAATLACLIIFVALVVRYVGRRNKKR